MRKAELAELEAKSRSELRHKEAYLPVEMALPVLADGFVAEQPPR